MEKVVLDCLKLKLKVQSYLELKLKYQSQRAGVTRLVAGKPTRECGITSAVNVGITSA